MASLDVFDGNAFEMVQLTEAINKAPYQPGFLGSLNLFESRPIRTEVAMIEDKQGKLALISTAARGSMKDVRSQPTRTVRDFRVPHVPYFQTILAADVQSIRAFGSETELEAVAMVVNDQLEGMRMDHEVTHEYHRIGAVKGQILDADGTTVIYDLFTEFGVSEISVTFDHTAAAASMKHLSAHIIRQMSIALGNTPFRSVLALCGDQFFDAFYAHPDVVAGFQEWQQSRFFREVQIGPEFNADVNGFRFGGIDWVNYRGKIGDVDFIPTDEARFIPRGVRGGFLKVASPADFMDTANTRGRDFYASRERLPHNKGVELHTQSNVLWLPTRPRALIKGVATNIPATVQAAALELSKTTEEITHVAKPGDQIVVPSSRDDEGEEKTQQEQHEQQEHHQQSLQERFNRPNPEDK